MKNFSGAPKNNQASPRYSNAQGGAARFQIMTTITSPPRPSHRRARLILNICQYLCLILACVCLGYVALDYGGARAFQSYQSWRFDRLIKRQPPAQISSLMRWIDQELSALMNEPIARPTPDRSSSARPAARAPSPFVHPLPVGSLIGRLEIPRLGVSVMVLEGDDHQVLKKAVGHLPRTAFPGEPGNVVIAGHRDTFFRALSQIRDNDEIAFTTTQGAYNYKVRLTEKVGPRDVRVLEASDHPTLTLITCYPFYYVGPAPKRFVVEADEIQHSESAAPHQSLASGPPPSDSASKVQATSSVRQKAARVTSSRPYAEARPTPRLAALNVNSPVMNDAESTGEKTGAQPVDPASDSPDAVHKVFGKIRSWLGSIPGHLHQN